MAPFYIPGTSSVAPFGQLHGSSSKSFWDLSLWILTLPLAVFEKIVPIHEGVHFDMSEFEVLIPDHHICSHPLMVFVQLRVSAEEGDHKSQSTKFNTDRDILHSLPRMEFANVDQLRPYFIQAQSLQVLHRAR